MLTVQNIHVTQRVVPTQSFADTPPQKTLAEWKRSCFTILISHSLKDRLPISRLHVTEALAN